MTTALALRSTTHDARRHWWPWHRSLRLVEAPTVDIKFTWDNRRPGTDGFALWAAALGQRIADHGLDDSDCDLANLIALARTRGVAPVPLTVLADTAEPQVARVRAFAIVVSALVRSTSLTTAVAPDGRP